MQKEIGDVWGAYLKEEQKRRELVLSMLDSLSYVGQSDNIMARLQRGIEASNNITSGLAPQSDPRVGARVQHNPTGLFED